MTNRPLSPHLGVYKWGPHMLVSILHRVTGDGLALVGMVVLVWWLGALAYGGSAFETFSWAAGTPIGTLVLVGISWAFFNHMCSGVRHFVLDIGAGFELHENRRFSVATLTLGILLTAAFWAVRVFL
ncbi:MAG: succinate dehydrogenase, cytochrome b556 subunit [Candidatus Andeanibacterium colombiense]|uniref:Succinate dehydrogenase cytochrome b556 subunit n=1 Tax=Candidatus Andeanibacterium colombiense TaxID=3121345 RepID=A0AAJ6BNL3_9SPHN|nr:MAG: succinate dehydrogenase, cytochrome b556 subunit [Sphingomonadaceae bacterium]